MLVTPSAEFTNYDLTWNSKQQQQGYIKWQIDRGDLAKLRSLLTKDPVVRYLDNIDLTTLPLQVK